MPRFTIVLIHYQAASKHTELWRAANSIYAQTNQDFELLAYHNGPLLDTSQPFPIALKCSETFSDNAADNRNRGLREATGDYIIFMNSDNILYPNALEEISKAIDRPPRLFSEGKVLDKNDIVVYAIIARGIQRFGDSLVRCLNNPEYYLILTGNPPRVLYVDGMQLVMRRELWLAEGGWYDNSSAGDGVMYQRFAAKYGYRPMEMILGEHF